ncbi:serine protein kinase RIO [Nocardioides insulae]|uniref:serine protein kinase RIO n=1 Tax=Nocardioides insulae TaxID=394734 RepID=UPI000402152E|nr:RIO1 family regulatory kinase/ATPase [Nocardioides insulae]
MTSLEEQSSPDRLAGIDPAFVFDYVPYDDVLPREDPASTDAVLGVSAPEDPDALGPGRRWTTWYDVEPLCRGPEPRPAWVVTSQGAIDTELGVLKTGKEADAFLLERADPHDPGQQCILVAKRYRSAEHRTFHRSATYTEGRGTKRSRDQRALDRKSTWGRVVATAEWATAEWDALVRCRQLGLPVPYPVQVEGTEILMEWIRVEGADGPETAPRLAQTRPSPGLLASYFEQLREAMHTMTQAGWVHGDLSAYNLLAADDRLVIIDLPQMIDLVGHPTGPDLLLRDCTNVCRWFEARGLAVDPQDLFADLMAHAF